MSDDRNSIVSDLKTRSKSFQFVSELDIVGLDFNLNVHFSFLKPDIKLENDQRSMFVDLLQTIKADLDAFLKSQINYVRFCKQDKCLYHVFFIKNIDEKFILILGPINDHKGEQALYLNSFNQLTAEQIDHFLQK